MVVPAAAGVGQSVQDGQRELPRGGPPAAEDLPDPAVVDVDRGQHADAGVAVLGLVPGQEPAPVTAHVLQAGEPSREVGTVLQRRRSQGVSATLVR